MKNPSMLQKLADFAYEIKNEDGLLGELRDKKNEYLTFDRLSHGPKK